MTILDQPRVEDSNPNVSQESEPMTHPDTDTNRTASLQSTSGYPDNEDSVEETKHPTDSPTVSSDPTALSSKSHSLSTRTYYQNL